MQNYFQLLPMPSPDWNANLAVPVVTARRQFASLSLAEEWCDTCPGGQPAISDVFAEFGRLSRSRRLNLLPNTRNSSSSRLAWGNRGQSNGFHGQRSTRQRRRCQTNEVPINQSRKRETVGSVLEFYSGKSSSHNRSAAWRISTLPRLHSEITSNSILYNMSCRVFTSALTFLKPWASYVQFPINSACFIEATSYEKHSVVIQFLKKNREDILFLPLCCVGTSENAARKRWEVGGNLTSTKASLVNVFPSEFVARHLYRPECWGTAELICQYMSFGFTRNASRT